MRLPAILQRIPPLPIVPTMRSAWLAALAAPVAIVIASVSPDAWIAAPIAGGLLLALIIVDALMAGRLANWHFDLPADAEIGRDVKLAVQADISGRAGGGPPQAAFAFDARLGNGGRAEFSVPRGGDISRHVGAATVQPERRGPAAVTHFWLRWDGPLGLGARQMSAPVDHTVRIWPDLSPVRSPMLQTFLRNAQFGLVARRVRGEGTQFEALSEYQPGMDRRQIDWNASARHTKLYARENESERNNQIVFAFDCGQSMCEPVDGLPRIDRAVTAALTAAYVALKGGDRVALFGFGQRPDLLTPFVGGSRNFHRLQSAAAQLDYHAEEPNFTLALATLTARLQRRSLVVLFSDFSDPTQAELMLDSLGRMAGKHLVLFVTLEDSEIDGLRQAELRSIGDVASAVSADSLARQRAAVLERMRRSGIDVIEAPHKDIGYRLIDRYLQIKNSEAIG